MPVSKRKDNGKWGYRLYFRGTNYRKFIFKTREEALQAEAELVDKLRREVTIISSDMFLVEAVNKFLEHSAKIGKSKDRLRALHCNFNSFILPFFGDGRKIKDITHNDIYAFIDEQLKRDITKNTINHYVIDLNALLNWALNEEVIRNNPMTKVSRKHIKPEKIIKRYHTPKQIKKCESVLSGEERLFFRFLKLTGARLTEALSAQWSDVDYENREIIIRGTKTQESFRKLPMCNLSSRKDVTMKRSKDLITWK
jgi:integrase